MKYLAILLALCALAQGSALAASCSGADLTVTNVAVKGMNSDGGINHYQISGTVTNIGSAAQASSVLQSVDVYKGTVKLDAKSIPPLKAGESYTFSYISDRSSDAGNNTTHLKFNLDLQSPNDPTQNCSTQNDSFSLTF
jgi:hypothetical protein